MNGLVTTAVVGTGATRTARTAAGVTVTASLTALEPVTATATIHIKIILRRIISVYTAAVVIILPTDVVATATTGVTGVVVTTATTGVAGVIIVTAATAGVAGVVVTAATAGVAGVVVTAAAAGAAICSEKKIQKTVATAITIITHLYIIPFS